MVLIYFYYLFALLWICFQLFFFCCCMYRDELGRFVSNKRGLTSLKMEGCSNLGGFSLTSTSLSTLWLSDLHSLSKMVIEFPFFLFFSCAQSLGR